MMCLAAVVNFRILIVFSKLELLGNKELLCAGDCSISTVKS